MPGTLKNYYLNINCFVNQSAHSFLHFLTNKAFNAVDKSELVIPLFKKVIKSYLFIFFITDFFLQLPPTTYLT